MTANPAATGRAYRRKALTLVAVGVLGLAGCQGSGATGATGSRVGGAASADDGITDVVATTPIAADLARMVAGQRARVTGLIPPMGDPHTYEPTLRDLRAVAYADVAFTNNLLLEQQNLIRVVEQGVRPGVPVVPLAEKSSRYGGQLIPLVEDIALDTVWLGMRISGTGERLGASRTSEVELQATDVRGPGDAAAFLTTAFGEAEIYMNSADGFSPESNFKGDTATLPVDAHTHMSWAFSKPGIYEVDFRAQLIAEKGARPKQVGTATVTFAVGVSPDQSGADRGSTDKKYVLNEGHQDITVDLDATGAGESGEIVIRGDAPAKGDTRTNFAYPTDQAVIEVPNAALKEIPASADYRFLGRPGSETYMLPQAVLGKHVHGELDPHAWQDVSNAIAYVQLIRDQLIAVDPKGSAEYTANADRAVAELTDLDAYVRDAIASIPKARRHLVTTHDGYGYLGKAYDLDIAGFITPNPSVEPSSRDLVALTRTLENLKVPAVFLEPSLEGRAGALTETASRLGVRVCRIYGDSFSEEVTGYVQMMRYNADSLARCLAP
nr:anchored repeat ABC transporter, substrate-binding protein [Corynebacterium lactis]